MIYVSLLKNRIWAAVSLFSTLSHQKLGLWEADFIVYLSSSGTSSELLKLNKRDYKEGRFFHETNIYFNLLENIIFLFEDRVLAT